MVGEIAGEANVIGIDWVEFGVRMSLLKLKADQERYAREAEQMQRKLDEQMAEANRIGSIDGECTVVEDVKQIEHKP
jgi:hypothetical protein